MRFAAEIRVLHERKGDDNQAEVDVGSEREGRIFSLGEEEPREGHNGEEKARADRIAPVEDVCNYKEGSRSVQRRAKGAESETVHRSTWAKANVVAVGPFWLELTWREGRNGETEQIGDVRRERDKDGGECGRTNLSSRKDRHAAPP